MKKIYTLLLVSVFSFQFSTAQTNQLWGLTSAGGGPDSGGIIFRINLDGTGLDTTIHLFDTLTGFAPMGSLVQAITGVLYGMTSGGGDNSSGVIFSYDPVAHSYSKVYSFDYNTSGASPQGTLIAAGNSKLYGMTLDGGANGDGTLFSIDPTNNNVVHLYDFTDPGGRNPYGSLLEGTDSVLYGLTQQGGLDSVGTIFSFDLKNNTFSDLHNFTHATGDFPNGSLMHAENGLFYGMTSNGGVNGLGVIFSFNIADSVYTDIHDFNDTAGRNPFGSLIQASDGLLYGMTSGGGTDYLGVIFNFDPSVNGYADLLDFNELNGATPNGELMQASNSKLYGLTSFGGADSAGVLFSFDQSNSNYVDLLDFKFTDGQIPLGDLIEIVPTGIQENMNVENIQLYPNPAANQIRIRNRGASIERITILDVLGKEVYSQQSGTQSPVSETDINVSGLSEGVYFVQVQLAKGKWVGKFVKE